MALRKPLVISSGRKAALPSGDTAYLLSTTEQLRIAYDDTHYASFTVGSDGALTLSSKLISGGQWWRWK